MKLTLKPVDVPFCVGDVVAVNQPYDDKPDQPPYFQARIIQIILDGSLTNTSVIRERRTTHEIVISSAIYDLKPVGAHQGLPRTSVSVQFFIPEEKLFASQEELLDYRNTVS